MANHKKKNKKKKSRTRSSRPATNRPPETRASEAVTIAWTVTLTTLLLCILASVVAHFYVSDHPEAKKMLLLQELMLLAGAIVGTLSLLLLPVLYRVRRVPPPKGLVVFGVCVAVAPLLAILVRVLG